MMEQSVKRRDIWIKKFCIFGSECRRGIVEKEWQFIILGIPLIDYDNDKDDNQEIQRMMYAKRIAQWGDK